MLQLDPASPTTCATEAPIDRYHGLQFSGVKSSGRSRPTSSRVQRIRGASARRSLLESSQDALPPEEAAFLNHVFGLADLPLPSYRLAPLARRLPACLRALKVASLSAAAEAVARHPEALRVAIDALVIGVTSFFRDPHVFDHLRDFVIPALDAQQRPLRIWSAACSDGAELYSVAMLMTAHGATLRTLLGTDCRPTAIRLARQAKYALNQVAPINPDLRERFFVPCERGKFQIIPAMRLQCEWRNADLLQDPPPPNERGTWDMVLCRNMAIYLNDSAAARVWITLAAALRPGGFLVAGKAERPRVGGLYRVGPCVYRKQ